MVPNWNIGADMEKLFMNEFEARKAMHGRSSWFTQGEIQVFQEQFRKAYNNDHDQL